MSTDQPINEGEGSRTAARAYDERTRRFVERADVAAAARAAAEALDGPQGEELRQAEEEGKAHARAEDPQVHRER